MSRQARQLIDALKQALSEGEQVLLAKVVSVDKNNNTCEVEYNGMELGEIRLQANILANQKGFIIYPATDSIVLISKMEGQGNFFVSMFSEVEEVLIKVGDTKTNIKDSFLFEMNDLKFEIKDGFLVKKGSETLKKIVDDILDGIEQLTVNTNNGPSSVPVNVAVFQQIKVRVDQLLK